MCIYHALQKKVLYEVKPNSCGFVLLVTNSSVPVKVVSDLRPILPSLVQVPLIFLAHDCKEITPQSFIIPVWEQHLFFSPSQSE